MKLERLLREKEKEAKEDLDLRVKEVRSRYDAEVDKLR